jgi:hypothetical protein
MRPSCIGAVVPSSSTFGMSITVNMERVQIELRERSLYFAFAGLASSISRHPRTENHKAMASYFLLSSHTESEAKLRIPLFLQLDTFLNPILQLTSLSVVSSSLEEVGRESVVLP